MAQKPSIPRGTRDFLPTEMAKRNYIFNTIKRVFEKYGYGQLETPSMENLSTLTGKYGDEGDQLIFKILNSGDYLSKVNNLTDTDAKKLSFEICERALRYDLTVPLARVVVMHQNDIVFPFKRYQIQPVWRADRPQKGRYREFYQCDVDVLGSESLLNETEFILIYDEILSSLGLKDFSIKINNRKILSAIAQFVGKESALVAMTVAVDKLDKIGWDGVEKELAEQNFSNTEIQKLKEVFGTSGTNLVKLSALTDTFPTDSVGQQGIEELKTILDYLQLFNLQNAKVEIDLTLARGLSYYTGTIFEVKTNEVAMGSIGGGGRYDNLTEIFGLKGISGAGISIGAERLYDVMEELKLFPNDIQTSTKCLFINFGLASEKAVLPILASLRKQNIACELYPTNAKMVKQMKYANDKNIPYVVFAGEDEIKSGKLKVKDMISGEETFCEAKNITTLLLK